MMDENGREPSQVEFYKMTHTHRDGSFVSGESRDIYERASSLAAEHIGESSASTEASRVETQVMTELLGPDRYGRMRGYGVGVTFIQLSDMSRYTQIARESYSSADIRRVEAQMETMRHDYDVVIQSMRHNYDAEIHSIRTQINQLTSVIHVFVDSSRAPHSSSSRRDDDDHAPTDH